MNINEYRQLLHDSNKEVQDKLQVIYNGAKVSEIIGTAEIIADLHSKLCELLLCNQDWVPGLRYWEWQASPNSLPRIWASTLNEKEEGRYMGYITELDAQEYYKLRRSEWAQLATPPQPEENLNEQETNKS